MKYVNDYLSYRSKLTVQLENIAETLSIAPQSLIRPYYRSIAIEVVKDLVTKPQKAQQLVDFLRMSVPQFLVLTQRDTIPFLVLTKKRDILQRIAAARSPPTSVDHLCLQPSANLAAILALLLVQPTNDVEASAIETLTEIAPAFANSDLTGLLKLDPVQISCELLKAAGDEDGGNVVKVCRIQIILYAMLTKLGTSSNKDIHYPSRATSWPVKAERERGSHARRLLRSSCAWYHGTVFQFYRQHCSTTFRENSVCQRHRTDDHVSQNEYYHRSPTGKAHAM